MHTSSGAFASSDFLNCLSSLCLIGWKWGVIHSLLVFPSGTKLEQCFILFCDVRFGDNYCLETDFTWHFYFKHSIMHVSCRPKAATAVVLTISTYCLKGIQYRTYLDDCVWVYLPLQKKRLRDMTWLLLSFWNNCEESRLFFISALHFVPFAVCVLVALTLLRKGEVQTGISAVP